MNIKDMHVAFNMELDKAMLSSMPSFDEYQIDYFLNNAYLMIINQKLTGHNVLQQGFEDSIKRISDLQKLIKTTIIDIVPEMVTAANEFKADLSVVNDLMYPVSSTINAITRFESTIQTTHEQSDNMKFTNINKPWLPVPCIVYGDDNIYIYVDPDVVDDYNNNTFKLVFNYIKRPERLNFNSTSGNSYIPEISEHVHPEIISLAANLAVENIESQRVQTYPNINQINRE